MEIKLQTVCFVKKNMGTDRNKVGDSEIVTCKIGVKDVRVSREQMDELAGYPAGTTMSHYNELGQPHQITSFLLPKRELLANGKIEHLRESGAAFATLMLKQAVVADLRFMLDVPIEQGPTAIMQFNLIWKAAGDEVNDVEGLLRRNCIMNITFKEPPLQQPLFNSSTPDKTAEKKAGTKQKLDRKRKAAGEKESDNDPDATESTSVHEDSDGVDELLVTAIELVKKSGRCGISFLQKSLQIGYNRAARMVETMELMAIVSTPDALGARVVKDRGTAKKGSTLAEIEAEAKVIAAKHPRKEKTATRDQRSKH